MGVEQFPTTIPTFAASVSAFAQAATATDFAGMTGVTGKVVKILKISVTPVQTTAGLNLVSLIKRSAANTTGTPTAMTVVPLDSINTATAAPVTYGANPGSLGTAVGTLISPKIATSVPASATSVMPQYDFIYDGMAGSPIVLRSASEGVYLNFGGTATPTGLIWQIAFVWVEFGTTQGA